MISRDRSDSMGLRLILYDMYLCVPCVCIYSMHGINPCIGQSQNIMKLIYKGTIHDQIWSNKHDNVNIIIVEGRIYRYLGKGKIQQGRGGFQNRVAVRKS